MQKAHKRGGDGVVLSSFSAPTARRRCMSSTGSSFPHGTVVVGIPTRPSADTVEGFDSLVTSTVAPTARLARPLPGGILTRGKLKPFHGALGTEKYGLAGKTAAYVPHKPELRTKRGGDSPRGTPPQPWGRRTGTGKTSQPDHERLGEILVRTRHRVLGHEIHRIGGRFCPCFIITGLKGSPERAGATDQTGVMERQGMGELVTQDVAQRTAALTRVRFQNPLGNVDMPRIASVSAIRAMRRSDEEAGRIAQVGRRLLAQDHLRPDKTALLMPQTGLRQLPLHVGECRLQRFRIVGRTGSHSFTIVALLRQATLIRQRRLRAMKIVLYGYLPLPITGILVIAASSVMAADCAWSY